LPTCFLRLIRLTRRIVIGRRRGGLGGPLPSAGLAYSRPAVGPGMFGPELIGRASRAPLGRAEVVSSVSRSRIPTAWKSSTSLSRSRLPLATSSRRATSRTHASWRLAWSDSLAITRLIRPIWNDKAMSMLLIWSWLYRFTGLVITHQRPSLVWASQTSY
jgi:hypothetical protein